MSIKYDTGKKLKNLQQSRITADEPVLKSFISDRVTANSKECLSRASTGQASTPYNNIGRHLARIRLNITYSDAERPTLLKIALNDLKN